MPSDAEEQAALYNMACAYAALGQREAALTCVEAAFESGFEDVETLKTDPDLASLRGGADWERVVGKYTGVGGMLNKLFSKKEKVVVSDPNSGEDKPWVLW